MSGNSAPSVTDLLRDQCLADPKWNQSRLTRNNAYLPKTPGVNRLTPSREDMTAREWQESNTLAGPRRTNLIPLRGKRPASVRSVSDDL